MVDVPSDENDSDEMRGTRDTLTRTSQNAAAGLDYGAGYPTADEVKHLRQHLADFMRKTDRPALFDRNAGVSHAQKRRLIESFWQMVQLDLQPVYDRCTELLSRPEFGDTQICDQSLQATLHNLQVTKRSAELMNGRGEWVVTPKRNTELSTEPRSAQSIVTVNAKRECEMPERLQQAVQSVVRENTHGELTKQLVVYRREMKKLRRQLADKTQELRQFQLVVESTNGRLRREQDGVSGEEPVDQVDDINQPEHTARLRQLYVTLLEQLEAKSAAPWMFQRGAITMREMERIQSTQTASDGADKLLKILMKAPREVFECFMEALRCTNQPHVYLQIQCADYVPDMEHCKLLRRRYIFLLDSLDACSSRLVSDLYSAGVLSLREKQDIDAELTSTRQNEKLLSVLSRKSEEQWGLFLTALDNTGQNHIRHSMIESEDYNRAVPIVVRDIEVESEINENVELRRRVEQLSRQLTKTENKLKKESVKLSEVKMQLTSAHKIKSVPVPAFAHAGSTDPAGTGVYGLCVLDARLYVARSPQQTIDIYDSQTMKKLDEKLDLCNEHPGCMALCNINRCLYVTFYNIMLVQKIYVDSKRCTEWTVQSKPDGVSVTPSTSVLVAFPETHELIEFDSNMGRPLFRINTPLPSPRFAISLSDDQYLVCFRDATTVTASRVRLICKCGNSLRNIVTRARRPVHLAVGLRDFVLVVFVADFNGSHVAILDPQLEYVCEAISTVDSEVNEPIRLCFNETCDRLFIGEYACKHRVVAFDVNFLKNGGRSSQHLLHS